MHGAMRMERALRLCIADGIPRAGGLGDTGKGHPFLEKMYCCCLLEPEVKPSVSHHHRVRRLWGATCHSPCLCRGLALDTERRLGLRVYECRVYPLLP